MKAAVVEWAYEDRITPLISRASCLAFRRSLSTSPSGDVALPDGLHVWAARYVGRRKFEAHTTLDHADIPVGFYKGCHIAPILWCGLARPRSLLAISARSVASYLTDAHLDAHHINIGRKPAERMDPIECLFQRKTTQQHCTDVERWDS